MWSRPYFVPSTLAAPWPEQPAGAAPAPWQADLVAAPALVEVEVELPPIAVLLAQHDFEGVQLLAAAPALADVEVVLPPMAVLLAQQALEAWPPEQDLCTAAPEAVFSDLALEHLAGDCAATWPANINPPIMRPQTIKIFEIDFIFSILVIEYAR